MKSQCHASTLVTKVKLVERSFKDGVTVRFEMYDLAPSDPPAPLPYFVKPDGSVISDELELSKYLAAEGSPALAVPSESESLVSSEAEVNKAIKTAVKSKNTEVCCCFGHRASLVASVERETSVSNAGWLWMVVCVFSGVIWPCNGHKAGARSDALFTVDRCVVCCILCSPRVLVEVTIIK